MSPVPQVIDFLRKLAASRVSVSPLSALCLWSRFPSSSSSVWALRVDASGGLTALIAAQALWTLYSGGRQHELKLRLLWKEAGTSARAEDGSSHPLPYSIRASPKEKCVHVFLSHPPRISDNGISLYEGDPRRSRRITKKQVKGRHFGTTSPLHVWAQFTVTLIHSDPQSFLFFNLYFFFFNLPPKLRGLCHFCGLINSHRFTSRRFTMLAGDIVVQTYIQPWKAKWKDSPVQTRNKT